MQLAEGESIESLTTMGPLDTPPGCNWSVQVSPRPFAGVEELGNFKPRPIDDDDRRPCTCTIACTPLALADGQTCRLSLENEELLDQLELVDVRRRPPFGA